MVDFLIKVLSLSITKVLLKAGMLVYGIYASPTMVHTFQQNSLGTPVACEAVEDSLFLITNLMQLPLGGCGFFYQWMCRK